MTKNRQTSSAKAPAEARSALPMEISNPGKVFWPEEGYTKRDLALFYKEVFPLLRPYVADRMLTLERCPDGMLGGCFYQKEMPDGMPADTPTKRIANATGRRKSTRYVVGGSLLTQIALVNLGCIPVHVMGSRARNFPKPDWICFDLDPASGRFQDAAAAGLLLKEALELLGLVGFPKTSGSRGLHVLVPIRVGPAATEVLRFAEELVARLAQAHPKKLTIEHSIAKRGDRVYLDPFRNGSVQTVVSPYSVRRKPHAPFSAPLAWPEVTASLDPSSFNLGNFRNRLEKSDPWKDFARLRQNFRTARQKLHRI
jgi:bifunctional non-homologous end joining protein LigD